MKKLFAIILTVVIVLSCTSVVAFASEQNYNFEDNLINLYVKHSGYKVTLEKFAEHGVIEIRQKSLSWYVLVLDKHDHQNVLDVISKIGTDEYKHLYTVSPEYLPQPETPEVEDKSLYKEKFIEDVVIPLYSDEGKDNLVSYSEYGLHYDAENNLDWLMIQVLMQPFEEIFCSSVVCGKYIFSENSYPVFPVRGLGVYDVKADEFRGVSHPDNLELDGFEEYVWENIGEFMGDADADGELTVLDATFIQQALAGIHEFSLGDNKSYGLSPFYLSDYDQDGERTVMDATAIQMKLAGIE